jgi:hypothetical protein
MAALGGTTDNAHVTFTNTWNTLDTAIKNYYTELAKFPVSVFEALEDIYKAAKFMDEMGADLTEEITDLALAMIGTGRFLDAQSRFVLDARFSTEAVAADSTSKAFNEAALAAYYALLAAMEDYDGVIFGDVNGDGVVNTADAMMILRYVAELVELDAKQLKAADVNGDGSVTTADAMLILRYVAELITSFPVQD